MKLGATIAIFVVCMTVAYCMRCDNADECSPDECCVAPTQLHLFGRGRCVKLGRQGRRCNEPEAVLEYYGGKFLASCPCQEGLTCESRGFRNGSTNRLARTMRQRCQRPSSTTAVPSTSTSSTTRISTPSTSPESTPSTSSESTSSTATISTSSTTTESTTNVS